MRVALTIGDPTGIGPEIAVKGLQQLSEFPDTQFIVLGDMKALEANAHILHMVLPHDERVVYHGTPGDLPGSSSYSAIEAAVKMIADNQADALVTGPISKKNLHAADYAYAGQTEILEELARRYFSAKEARAEMLFVHKNFRLLLLTRHVALKDVPATLSKPGAVAGPLKALIVFLRHKLQISEPRIAILGLNPHVGEIGGDEEKNVFSPVIKAVNAIGASRLEGPFAADGFFRGFDLQKNPYDAVVAAYHDQGLIPFKILAGHEAVNMTIGLPFIRTSVSHGTAEDIAGQGIAREDSLIAAIHTAIETFALASA